MANNVRIRWNLSLAVITIANVLFAVFLAYDNSSVTQYKHQPSNNITRESEVITADNAFITKLPVEKVTMVIMTYKRLEVFLNNPSLTSLVPLDIVAELLIVWNDVDNHEEALEARKSLDNLGIGHKVRFYYPATNSMNNRFTFPLETLSTKAVFYLDDEWTLSVQNFEAGWQMWQKQPYRYVGFLPRGIKYHPIKDAFEYLAAEYDTKDVSLARSVKEFGFNMVLPGGGLFIHTDYLKLYQSDSLKLARDYVDEVFNCDDLLLNFIVPEEYQPPILVSVEKQRSYQYVIDYENGISKDWSKYVRRRQSCMRKFRDELNVGYPSTWSKHTIKDINRIDIPRSNPAAQAALRKLPSSSTGPTRAKYFLGCNPVGWKDYVRPEYYYLFQGLIDDHDWEELSLSEVENPNFKQQMLSLPAPPRVIMFCENHAESLHLFPVKELQEQGTKFAVYSDDTLMYNRFSTKEMAKILGSVDVLVSTYAYRLSQYFRKIQLDAGKSLPKFLWLPHSASPAYTALEFNVEPLKKIFLSGSIGLKSYPIREWLRKKFLPKNKDIVIDYRHPGYTKVPLRQTERYVAHIRSYLVGITTTMINRRLVAKVFEIPATGSLLLVNLDLEPMLKALGMINMKHYVGFSNSNPSRMILWTMDEDNRDRIEKIRRQGMQLVREKHKTEDRVEALDLFFETGHESYPFKEMKRDHPCPMKGTKSLDDCRQIYRERVLYHDPSKPKNQPFPLRKKKPAYTPPPSNVTGNVARMPGKIMSVAISQKMVDEPPANENIYLKT